MPGLSVYTLPSQSNLAHPRTHKVISMQRRCRWKIDPSVAQDVRFIPKTGISSNPKEDKSTTRRSALSTNALVV